MSSQHQRNPSIDGSKKQRRSWQKRRDGLFDGAENRDFNAWMITT
jgi:hypothetical protein